MKLALFIFRIILISITLAVIHVFILRSDISFESFSIGVIHGAVIGFFIGLFLGYRKFYFYSFFKKFPFLFVILINSTIYLFLILFGRAVAKMITHEEGFNLIPLDDPNFFRSVIYIFVVLVGFNMLEQISLLTGQRQLLNFVFGKYTHAQLESRMIMFIDMTNSTKIAEQIGDAKFLSLLDDFFSLMTIPLKESNGEIYKYIGDEAIITWGKNKHDANISVRFFFKFKKEIQKHEAHFLEKYNTIPKFRAGLHYGNLLIGELGSTKKEIALIGSSINTTSRILEIGKKLDRELVTSEILGKQFSGNSKHVTLTHLGEKVIRGQEEKLVLYSLEKKI